MQLTVAQQRTVQRVIRGFDDTTNSRAGAPARDRGAEW
jgi:hypothetical protein